MNPQLDIIIVTYNSASCIEECLRSLFETTQGLQKRVIIVDNASLDTTIRLVREKYNEVEVIVSNKNLGFAKANNLALAGSSAPYVLFLNPDTIVLDGAVRDMLLLLETGKADIIGPQLLNGDGSFQRWAGGYFPTLMRAFRHYFFLPGKGVYLSLKNLKEAQVDWISGASFMFKRQVLKKVGLLREDFFMYAEDMEFCWRAKSNNLRVLYYPQAKVIHLYGRSPRNKVSKANFQSLENLSRFFREQKGFIQGKAFDLITALGFTIRLSGYYLMFLIRKSSVSKLRAIGKLAYVSWKICLK